MTTLPSNLPDWRFDRALEITGYFEGGLVHRPKDPGGLTNRGITDAVYRAWRHRHHLPDQHVSALTDAEFHAIYQEDFWVPATANALAWPLCAVHFDSAVNHGRSRATKLLHASNYDARQYCDARLAFYHALVQHNADLAVFLRGWTRRVHALQYLLITDETQSLLRIKQADRMNHLDVAPLAA